MATIALVSGASAWVVVGSELRALERAPKSEVPSDAAIVAVAAQACESGRSATDAGLHAVPWNFVGRRGAYVVSAEAARAVPFLERNVERAGDFARAETTLDALGEGMLLVDATGRIEVATSRAAELLHQSPAELEGSSAAFLAPSILTLEPGEIVRGALPDRALHFVAHHRAQPVEGPEEAPGVVVRLRADGRFANTRQRQMQLLSILRHDVRSPLTSVRGLVSVLLDEPDMPRDERMGLLELLRQEADRTVTWVEDYLVTLRLRLDPRPQHRVDCDLGDVLRALESLFARHAEERQIDFGVELPPPGPRPVVHAEAALLESFAKNLVGHAFRLADAGASIRVRVAPDTGALEVRANGPGLFASPPRQPFTTLSRSTAAGKRTPGVGLGLFLAKKIADSHGWRLEVRHDPTDGLLVAAAWGSASDAAVRP